MGKLEDRENRRKTSIIAPIVGVETEGLRIKKGRTKEDRETKKRVSLSVMPSLYKDIQKIAYVQRRSVSEIVADEMKGFRDRHMDEIVEYDRLKRDGR